MTTIYEPISETDLDDAAIVRPYTWTQGRTRADYQLNLETLVSTSPAGERVERLTQVEHRTIAMMCRKPHSVAEVAAKLAVPLGVARVILSDMAMINLITIHRTHNDTSTAAHFALMERVLTGLRQL